MKYLDDHFDCDDDDDYDKVIETGINDDDYDADNDTDDDTDVDADDGADDDDVDDDDFLLQNKVQVIFWHIWETLLKNSIGL